MLLRAANVGGNNVFRPAQLALALKPLQVINVGAVGTFVVRGKTSAAGLRREILSRLEFAPALGVYGADEVLRLVRSNPFEGVRFSRDLRGWAAGLVGKPKREAELPLSVPSGRSWSVRLDRVEGAFALGLWRRRPKFVFPSTVVEGALGVPATTRFWETFERVARVLEA